MKITTRTTPLTTRTIRAALSKREGRQVISDQNTRGLVLVINPTSARYEFRWRPRGKQPDGKRYTLKSKTIGTPETMSIEEARLEAAILGAQAMKGDIVSGSQGGNLDDNLDRYLAALKTKKGNTQYLREQERNLKAAIAGHKDINPAKIGRADILSMLDQFADRPDTHRHAYGALRRFFKDMEQRDIIPISPADGIPDDSKPAPSRARDRFFTKTEIAAYLTAARKIGGVKGDIALALAYIPARRSEVSAMTWDEIDLDARTWTLPGLRTKNGDMHRYHLHDLAIDMLERRKAATGGKGLVFPSAVHGGELSGWSQLKSRISKAAKIDGWTWHDWRRTFVSLLAEREHVEVVLDGIINHRQSATRGGVLGVYNVSVRWDDRVRAINDWYAVLRNDDPPTANNVIVLAPEKRTASK